MMTKRRVQPPTSSKLFGGRSLGFLGICILLFASLSVLESCGSSQVVTSLEVVIVSAEAAVTALGATGTIPPATVVTLDAYLKSTMQATLFASTELQSSDPPAVKATKIVQQFAAIAAPNLPPGTPAAIVAVIQAVTSAVAGFLQTIQPAAAQPAARPAMKITFSPADENKLVSIHSRAQALIAKLP